MEGIIWKNLFFRACCLEQINQADDVAAARQRFDAYLNSLERNHRQDQPEYQELKALQSQ